MDIIFGIAFIMGVLSIIFPELIILDINTALGNIATLPIIFCLQFYVFFRNKELAYNRDLETNKGSPIEIKLSITENSINILRGLDQAINIELINIEKVVKTKNYYILVSKAKLAISLKKDSFINGTAKQFEEFLKQKKLIK